ncbi:hypothetical protein Ancab_033400 [Ancistrocladus abbreviatus]
MSGDTVLIQDAMGEKVAKFIQLMGNFVGGFVIAFLRGWLLALVLIASIPALVIAGGIMAIIMTKMASRAQMAYAEAGNVVEQTVGVIRMVASFTGEKEAVRKYDTKLEVAYTATVHQGLTSGLGLGSLYFIIFGTYALTIWFGGRMIIEKGYNGGQVLNVIMSMMTGGMSLGQTSPCLNAFAAGQAAAFKMFETIERQPKIDASSNDGIILEDIKGEIELKYGLYTMVGEHGTQLLGAHEELTKDPDRAYSRPVRLQVGAHEDETPQTKSSTFDMNLDIDETEGRSISQRFSIRRSKSRGSSSGCRSFSINYGIPSPVGIHEADLEADGGTDEEANKKPRNVSIKQLACLNKPELPILLLGAVAASVHGIIFPLFGNFISSGAIGARLSTDASNVRSLVWDQLALVMQNIATVVAGLVIAFTANWILALIVLSVASFIFAEGYFQGKFLKGFSTDAMVSALLKLYLI